VKFTRYRVEFMIWVSFVLQTLRCFSIVLTALLHGGFANFPSLESCGLAALGFMLMVVVSFICLYYYIKILSIHYIIAPLATYKL